jgi:hypothetical protein
VAVRLHIIWMGIIMAETRVCSKCKKELATMFFYRDKSAKSGFTSACRSCTRASRRQRYAVDDDYRGRRKFAAIAHYHNDPVYRKRQLDTKREKYHALT